jgi:LCP family protein required for cell wall assembly
MNSKKKKTVILTILILILLVLGGSLIYRMAGKMEEKRDAAAETDNTNTSAAVSSDSVYYQGQEYRYNRDIENILFMGVDKKEQIVLQDTPGKAGQADSIMILSMNKKDKTARILQISRDSMTDIDIYDTNGNYYTTVQAQLATQYAYGNGGQSSCYAMKKTVSELLYDLPIDGYISLNIEAIGIMNDAVGGVTLTVPKDYTMIDPAFVQGSTITLSGEQAEKYVRYRDTNEKGSNNGRMERQVQYIPALISAVKGKVGQGGDYYEAFYPLLSSYMVTDLSGDQMNQLSEYQLQYDKTEYVPGEVHSGEEHEEFHVDDAKLREVLVEMFYKVEE